MDSSLVSARYIYMSMQKITPNIHCVSPVFIQCRTAVSPGPSSCLCLVYVCNSRTVECVRHFPEVHCKVFERGLAGRSRCQRLIRTSGVVYVIRSIPTKKAPGFPYTHLKMPNDTQQHTFHYIFYIF